MVFSSSPIRVRPNGSRLSCGASAGGRKRPALRYELVGAQTYASFESRPVSFKRLLGRAPYQTWPLSDRRHRYQP